MLSKWRFEKKRLWVATTTQLKHRPYVTCKLLNWSQPYETVAFSSYTFIIESIAAEKSQLVILNMRLLILCWMVCRINQYYSASLNCGLPYVFEFAPLRLNIWTLKTSVTQYFFSPSTLYCPFVVLCCEKLYTLCHMLFSIVIRHYMSHLGCLVVVAIYAKYVSSHILYLFYSAFRDFKGRKSVQDRV